MHTEQQQQHQWMAPATTPNIEVKVGAVGKTHYSCISHHTNVYLPIAGCPLKSNGQNKQTKTAVTL